jgi:iron complex outermembrane receptor protein
MLCKVIILAGLSFANPAKPDGSEPIDTIAIEGIVVNSKLQRFSSSLSLKVIPASELRQSKHLVLTDLLSAISNITINSYGQGGLSSATLRGLGSYHTAILWNGINLQSPMTGGVNLSIIPVNFIDQLAIQYGGNGALFGSGAIGGTIHLSNILELGKGHSAEVYQTYGSYNTIFSGVNYTYSGLRFASSTRVFYSETDNDYKFHNITKIGQPYENQVNSNSNKNGLMQNFVYQLTKANKLSSSVWLQNAFNRYPPMMTASSNREKDYNNFFRGVIQWSSTHKKIDVNTKASYFYDIQRYRNPGIGDTSNHYSNNGIIESEAIIKLAQNHNIETGININNERITSTNYPSSKERTRTATSVTYRYTKIDRKLDFYAGLREEMVGNRQNPITWSFGSRFKLTQRLILRSNISRNYRIPDMNDLYWSGYLSKGNPTLKPEHGYSEEIGVDYLLINDNSSFITKLSAFNSNVSDWIIWLQDDQGDKSWSPVNAKKVWSRGVDASISFANELHNWQWRLDLMGTGTISTTEESATESDIGKQLPYIPKIKASGSFYLRFNSYTVKYNHSYTGKRNTPYNALTIVPYSIASISFEKTFEGHVFSIRSFLRIDNLFNKEYQVMAWYPMPLRSYQLGVSILFNKPIH